MNIMDEDLLVWDEFDEAIIGISEGWHGNMLVSRVAYDADKILFVMTSRMDMTIEEAMEHLEVNMIGGYIGDQTPIVVWRKTPEEVLGE